VIEGDRETVKRESRMKPHDKTFKSKLVPRGPATR
jgi:hypothetical protein